MNRFLLLAALAGIALAMTACGPATPTTTAGTGTGGGAGGGSSEPPAAPTPTPDPDPPAPPEPDKRWDLDADHFGDDDATIWSQTSNRSAPFAWDRITAANRDAVKVSVGGQPLPIDNLSYEPAFASDFSGAEWRLAAEVTEGAVVLVLTAENQRRTTGRVASVTITNGGTGYTSAPTVAFTTANPNFARATATAADQVASVTISNGGSGYSLSDVGVQDYVITFVSQPGDPGSGAAAKTSARWSTVGSVNVPASGRGSGYTSVPAVSFTGGTGMGAAAVAVGPTQVRAINLNTGGSGYTDSMPATFTCTTPTGGVAAIGRGVLNAAGTVTSITVTNPGLGYTTAPTCSPSHPASGGVQATSIGSTLEDRVLSVRVTNPGVGYGGLPSCAITGTATCTADYGVTQDHAGMYQDDLIITDPGSGYAAAPDVEFPEPQYADGIRAQGTAALTDKVTSITVTDGGSGYREAPTVEISGGGGNDDATAVAKLGVSGYTEFDNLYWARQTLYGKELVIEIAEEEAGS